MKRSIQLDFLRFLGIFLVMINHSYVDDKTVLGSFIKEIWYGGWIGVDLFFVLSGYLVSGLIFNEYKLYDTFNSKNFLIRRGFKIYPTFYFFLISSYFFFNYATKEHYSLIKMVYEGVFISNYMGYNNGHIWSICVEEHFYFLLALVFFVLIKYKKVQLNVFVGIYLSLLILGLVCRYYNYLHYSSYDFDRDYTQSHYRFDALFFGVLLSYIAHYKSDLITKALASKLNIPVIIVSVVFLCSNFVFPRPDYRFISVVNLAINPVCFGYLMINIISFKNNLFLKLITPLAYVGKYSYSIYLFHKLFNFIAIHAEKSGGAAYFLLYFLLSIGGGILISKLIEYPLINLREKYFPSRSVKPHAFKPAD